MTQQDQPVTPAPVAPTEPKAPQQTQATPPWLEGADPETVGWVEQWGYKAPLDVVKSMRELEKLKGASPRELVKLPRGDDDDGWSKLYADPRLGRPEKPEGYGVEPGGLTEALLPKAWEVGLSKRQVAKLVPALNEAVEGIASQREEEFAARSAQEEGELKGQLGPEGFNALLSAGRAAVAAHGLTKDELSAFERAVGTKRFYEVLGSIGKPLVAAGFVEGDRQPGFGMTIASANAKIGELKRDPNFAAAFLDRTHPGNREAVALMARLNSIANPDQGDTNL